jgi:N-methylhydantoinase B
MVDPDLPNNAGYFRPIAVRAPLGTIVNPRAPAAVSSRGVTGHRVVDAVLGVLAQVAPDRMPAASEGGPTSIRIACQMGGGRVRVAYDSMSGAWGARPNMDGIDGCSSFAANIANVPVEVIESEFPLRITRYGLRQDSGGAGKWRGGMGLLREWEVLGASAVATVRADRARFRPWGLRGGGPGGAGSNRIVSRDGHIRAMPSKFRAPLASGDRMIHEQAGGGGFGSPVDRDPGLVLRDWRDERVSRRSARTLYGVVIGREGNVDVAATRRLRKTLGSAARPNREEKTPAQVLPLLQKSARGHIK